MPDTITPRYYVCLLNNYNNYFNRIIKGFATLAEYETAVGEGNFYLFNKPINFNPQDNVSTEIVMNNCPFEPDYAIIFDGDGDIVSRWFVMEGVFTREKQRKFSLRRDLIFDFRDELANSKMFVQKAHLQDTDSFIVNDEGMSLNQIKKSERLLKDRTNSAWIVGYIAKDAAATDVTVQVADETFDFVSFSDIATEMGVSEADLASILNFDGTNTTPAFFTKAITYYYGTYYQAISSIGGGTRREYIEMLPDLSNGTHRDILDYAWQDTLWSVPTSNPAFAVRTATYLKAAIIANKSAMLAQLPTIFNHKYFTEAQYNTLYKYVNKIIRYNGIYYKLSFNVENSSLVEKFGPYAYTAYTSLRTAVETASTNMGLTPKNTGDIFIQPTSIKAFVQMETISAESGIIPSAQVKVSSSRKTVINQAFDMFCIPYGPAKFKSDIGNREAISDYALSLGAAIAVSLDAKLYDLQLLPYCPLLEYFDSNNRIDLTALNENVDFNYINKTSATIRVDDVANLTPVRDISSPTGYSYSYSWDIPDLDPNNITDSGWEFDSEQYVGTPTFTVASNGSGGTLITFSCYAAAEVIGWGFTAYYEKTGTDRISFLLWARNASFSTQLNYNLALTDSMKIESQCNNYRLVSPNYQGSFDFNLAKNGGASNFIIAECTYKPYTPYIKIAPQFSFLYGSNFGDHRGLICGGDFSLPRFNSAWETYLLNNKNFQNIFNRDIQNLTFEQDRERLLQGVSGLAGLVGAGAVGAGAGAKAGGVYGAIAGAVIGTGASAGGMALDRDILILQQRETKSLAIDKYNYNLGNVKALPYTITKVGAFDINSKIWPFLEFYTCTPEEKEALENKITFESMTVMRIDTAGNYMFAFSERYYLKGELIRNEEIGEDNHVFEAIYAEFVKGVYI